MNGAISTSSLFLPQHLSVFFFLLCALKSETDSSAGALDPSPPSSQDCAPPAVLLPSHIFHLSFSVDVSAFAYIMFPMKTLTYHFPIPFSFPLSNVLKVE
jgi:hypothetical protein